MKPAPEMHEGPHAADKFKHAVGRILSVPKAELVRREADYQRTKPAKKTSRTTPR